MRHYPGEPKPSYIAPWEETPHWERESAATVYDQVRAFIDATDGGTAKLTRAQNICLVTLCWIGQIFKHFSDPKQAYVAGLVIFGAKRGLDLAADSVSLSPCIDGAQPLNHLSSRYRTFFDRAGTYARCIVW